MQIFMTQVGSDKGTQLTLSETDSSVVDAAPDGRSVILSSAKEESNLWRVGVTDSQESPVVRDLNTKLWPAVSPNDEKVAYQSIRNFRGGNRLFDGEILAKSLKSRDETERATVLASTGFFPVWAPDGSSLAFMRKNADTVALYSANVGGGGEKRLTAGGIPFIGYSISPYNSVQARAFAWSPDSSRIAYVSDRNGAANIWTVEVRDNVDAALTNNVDADLSFFSPMWSADGKKLAFYFQTRTPDASGKITRGLKLYDTVAGQLITVRESDKPIRLIGWTPDEAGLVFAESEVSSGLPPATLIKRAAISGGKENLISDLKNVYFYNIFLSDDRKLIGYAARSGNKDDIWVISSGGGQARKLTSNNDFGLYFSRLTWLHDGSSIVFGKQTRYSLLSIITDIN